MTKSLPSDSTSTGAGLGGAGIYATIVGFVPDPVIRSILLGATPGVGWTVRLICMRVTHRMVVRDALKDYESVLEAIEIGKRRGASQAVLDEMKKTAEMALLRYTTLVGTVNAADAAIEKISKGEEP